ncbi:MAG: hypothetical protein KC505_08925 [Myxococcales bacterium]|nr:hypothetical protein [Myxococcales bacterium]USN49942.1 MAG: hypothetical protein H6731_06590 [Myxococcales bacterium]
MSKILSASVLSLIFCLHSAQASHNFSTTIYCSDPTEASKARVEIGLDLINNAATFMYHAANGEVINLNIGTPYGYGSSSHVTMKSSFNNRLRGEQSITISAHSDIITRILHYTRFELTLSKRMNAISIRELSYSKGIDAFPEQNIEAHISDLPLSCQINL